MRKLRRNTLSLLALYAGTAHLHPGDAHLPRGLAYSLRRVRRLKFPGILTRMVASHNRVSHLRAVARGLPH